MPASLLSAKIRGVRSYSPLEHKTQTIEFMPLTLIVGANGSGKTTVIESLKFIISGEEPPLSDSRRNFLHSSKDLIVKNQSTALIELKFNNSNDDVCLARREIYKTASNSAPSISSCYKVGNNSWKNVHKQDDWTRTVPLLFNLPNQAILNKVVLCHQEDNLWCMGDSASVKQIFDKVFGCEQYKKEIKHIEAEIKSCKSDLVLGERDLTHQKEKAAILKSLEDKVVSLSNDVKRIITETSSLISKIRETSAAKASTSEEVHAIEAKEREIDALERRKSELVQRRSALCTGLEIDIDFNVSCDTEYEERLNKELKELESQRGPLQDVINKLKVIKLKSSETLGALKRSLQALGMKRSIDETSCDIDISCVQANLKSLEEIEEELLQAKCDQAELEDNLSSKQRELSREIANLEGVYQGLLQKIKSKELLIENLSADSITTELDKVLDNLNKMQSITRHMSETDLAVSLTLLIDSSLKIIEKIIRDKNSKTSSDIAREKMEIDESRVHLKTKGEERLRLIDDQSKTEAKYNQARLASKDAHNRVIKFKNERKNIVTVFEKYQKEMEFLQSKDLSAKVQELREVDKKIESKRKELNTTSLNNQVRDISKQIKSIEEKLAELRADAGDVSVLGQLQSKLKQLDKEEIELRDKRSMLIGSKFQIDKELSRTQAELKNHSATNLKYAESMGKVVCSRIILSDLEKLKECFQQSITTFHNQMIVKINEVLRVRWRQIYQGSDIDRIELVDEEITKGKDRKAFNYFIAMRKGGVRMKMREMSSAGQKALASIILRMTLAELFVRDFAFIALDEPTANLDLANVQSLARIIGSYVRMRTRKGINIQWIIITHDELFLKSLDAECSPYYYRVQLDHEGCSKIVKLSYQDTQDSMPSSLESNSTKGER